MRINKYLALATGMSRRAADTAIAEGRVTIDNQAPRAGQDVATNNQVHLDGSLVSPPETLQTILFNKPAGYVCSRDGQGSKTIYDLLPKALHHLKPVGRLDKDSSGLLLLTNDGELAHQLTHPSFQKEKVYQVTLDKPLSDTDLKRVEQGIILEDGPSHLLVKQITVPTYEVRLSEGRNRQIRRTFTALNKKVVTLHRITFGEFDLGNLTSGKHQPLS